jgi:Ca-activated chloride channel family protein
METTLKDYRRLTGWPSLLILNFLLSPIWAFAQASADDYFHQGAQYYIFGQKSNAVNAISSGLRIYPTDEKLNGVAKLLQRKDPQDQSNSKSSQQNQDQQNQQQQNQQQQQKSSSQDQQDKKDQQKQAQQQKDKDQQNKAGQAKAGQQGKDQDTSQQQAAAVPAQMTRQQAQQMLDAEKDDEKALIFNAEKHPANPSDPKTKDW